jgi:hypothetical protein
LTNKKIKLEAQMIKEQKHIDFLANFNLAQTLVKSLGLQVEVKFYKDTTLR